MAAAAAAATEYSAKSPLALACAVRSCSLGASTTTPWHWLTVVPNNENPPKNRQIDGSYLFLQQFDKFWICSAHDDRKRKLCESAEKLKFHQVNLILAVFGNLGPLCMALPAVGWCAFALVVHTTTAKLLQQHKRWLMAFGPWSDSVLCFCYSCCTMGWNKF